MTNAFLCTPHDTLDSNAYSFCVEYDARLLSQRHREASTILNTPDRDITLRLGVGGMVGDHGGPVEFLNAFYPCIDTWKTALAEQGPSNLLICTDPITGQEVDASVVSYVDDIHAKHIMAYHDECSAEPICKLYHANAKLDEILLWHS